MDIWTGKIAVVTGASSGIGAAVALDLVRAGITVVGLARRKDRVEALASKASNAPGKIYAVECDLAETASILEAFKWIKAKFGVVHILINNAGRGKNSTTLNPEVPHEEFLATINVNLSGLVVCTREAYNLMAIHDEPSYIINVNSILGHSSATAAGSVNNVYNATKHALTNHTECVRLELAAAGKKRIRVSSLSPGCVATEFGASAGFTMDQIKPDFPRLQSQDVSDSVIYLLSLPLHVNVSELTIRPTGEQF